METSQLNGETQQKPIATLLLAPEEIALQAVSPIDGRYAKETKALSQCFSEYAVMRYRILVEIETIIALLTNGPERLKKDINPNFLRKFYHDFSVTDALRIKEIESEKRHDVKSVEYFLQEKFEEHSLGGLVPYIHYGTTSEDVDSFVRALSVRDALAQVIDRVQDEIITDVFNLFRAHGKTLMLARTHGQPALPTTFGKEMKVYWERLRKERKNVVYASLPVKWNGAAGTRAGHMFAHPGFNWTKFANDLVKQIENYEEHISDYSAPKLFRARTTAQTAPADLWAAFFDAMRRFNTILLDFCQANWRYISDGWLAQEKKEGEVGSSTMPQKINPIDFENAEGNLTVANALFEMFSRKLPVSRLQRDLSDSTVMRNFGVSLAHSLLAYKSFLKGLKKISPDEAKMRQTLEEHPEILAEGIQIVLRREGIKDAYDILKKLTRGEKVTMQSLRKFILALPVSDSAKLELCTLDFDTYVGFATGNVKNKELV